MAAKKTALAKSAPEQPADGFSKALTTTSQAMQGFEFDVVTVAPKDAIVYIPGMPLEYRSNAKEGVFLLADEVLDGGLAMEIVHARTFTADLFKLEEREWLQVFFVDTNQALSTILFKGTETVRNFKQLVHRLTVLRKSIIDQVITATMHDREGKDDKGKKVSYFAVEFGAKPNTAKRVELLHEFHTKYNGRFYSQDINAAIARAMEAGHE